MMKAPSISFSLIALFAAVAEIAHAHSDSSSAAAMERLVSQSRSLQNNNNNNNNNADYSFLSGYSVKFQGCHHVQQWNDQANDQTDVRIMTKRLARYRLCPSDSCSTDKSTGCSSKYGDYVVDLNTFVTNYMEMVQTDKATTCETAKNTCDTSCNGQGDDCLYTCYEEAGVSFCLDDDNAAFDINDYTTCNQVDLSVNRRYLANNNNNNNAADAQVSYYVGPYCADQGGEIQLGVFTDDTCTTFAQYGDSLFKSVMGFDLPYSTTSLINTACTTCSETNNNGYVQARQECGAIYALSGKCETRMDIDYPNESSCSYIEGIKIIREDGVIRTSTVRKSKSAAVAIGVFMTLGVLLAAYVYYLRTKLSRAQINLQAASSPLT